MGRSSHKRVDRARHHGRENGIRSKGIKLEQQPNFKAYTFQWAKISSKQRILLLTGRTENGTVTLPIIRATDEVAGFILRHGSLGEIR